VKETIQGYGAAMRRGLREATGDLLITVEPDGTFSPNDLAKLLEASVDLDAVYGTRTVRAYILPGANMGHAIRLGNWIVAKYIMVLFNGPSLSDSGCTYRLLHRHAYERIKDKLHVNGSHFLVDMMIRCMQAGIRFKEVPVHYGRRIGTSKITGKTWKAARLGWRIIFYAFGERLRPDPFRGERRSRV
jgi:glycosyltransferase involved in cell wall biosynthesis